MIFCHGVQHIGRRLALDSELNVWSATVDPKAGLPSTPMSFEGLWGRKNSSGGSDTLHSFQGCTDKRVEVFLHQMGVLLQTSLNLFQWIGFWREISRGFWDMAIV